MEGGGQSCGFMAVTEVSYDIIHSHRNNLMNYIFTGFTLFHYHYPGRTGNIPVMYDFENIYSCRQSVCAELIV